MTHRRAPRVLPASALRVSALLAVVVVAIAAVPWVARAASPSPAPELPAGLTMDARALLQGHARTGSWMAIRVDLANDGPPFSGELRLVGGTQGRTRFAVAVDLPTTSRKSYTINAQAPAFGSSLEVALVADEKVVGQRAVAFALHDATQLVVGVVAERPGPLVAALGRIRNPAGPVPAVVRLAPADLPDRPESWAALDRLVWQDVDAGQLSPEQLSALRTWLASGGRLTVLGGSGGIGMLAGFSDELLPFRPTATLDVDPTAIRGLLGGTLPAGAGPLPALAGSLGARARALASSGGRTIAADQSLGSGSVTLAGFDPSTPWLAESTAVDALWATIVPVRGTSRAPLIVGDDSPVVSLLNTLPALALPPIEGLLLLLFGYILLIGPVNYLILRRLDRREWAWVTMPLLVVGFTVAAYGIGSALRGTDVIVNQLAVVRAAQGTDAGQAQVFLGVFSPASGTYDIGVPGGALLSAPYSGESFGSSAGGGLDLVQGDPSRARGLSVGYGTLRAVRADAPVSAPRVEADLRLDGSRVVGTVVNASDRALRKAVVVLGTGVVTLGDLSPGATAKVDLRTSPNDLGRALSERIFGQQEFSADGRPTGDFMRDQVRRQLVDALTFDPMFGSNGMLPADGPVLLAWGDPGVLDVVVAGHTPRSMGETLYYLPMGLSAAGSVTFTPDLMRSSVVEGAAQFFTKDPFGMAGGGSLAVGGGSVTLAYRPIPVSGEIRATRLTIGVNTGVSLQGGAAGAPVEPAPPATAAPSAGAGNGTAPGQPPLPVPVAGDLPALELYDRSAGAWRALNGIASGAVMDVRNPSRFVDPASGTILVRLTNNRQDAVGFQLAVQLEADVR